jgi:hypothetical protein
MRRFTNSQTALPSANKGKRSHRRSVAAHSAKIAEEATRVRLGLRALAQELADYLL